MLASLQATVFATFQFLSQDISRLLILCVGGAMVGIVAGRGRMVMLLLNTYVTLALVTNAPWIAFLQRSFASLRTPYAGIIWFFILYVCILILFWRSRVLDGTVSDRGTWVEAALFGIVQLGCLLSCVFFLLPDMTAQWSWSPVLMSWFGDPYARSFWLSAPLILMAIRIGLDSITHDREMFLDEKER